MHQAQMDKVSPTYRAANKSKANQYKRGIVQSAVEQNVAKPTYRYRIFLYPWRPRTHCP